MSTKKNIIVDFIEWDVVNWSKALTFWETHLNSNQQKLNCIELGSRRGGLSLWLASKGHDVICSDYLNPSEGAGKVHSQHSFPGKITYQAVDATNIPYENYFDIVVFKSILGGISRNGEDHLKQKTIDEIYKSLKPGGKLLFAENLVASGLHKFLRKYLTKWGSYWNYLNLNEIDNLFQKYSELKYGTAGFLSAFGINEFQRNLLGKVDTVFFERIVDKSMRYIVFGVATK